MRSRRYKTRPKLFQKGNFMFLEKAAVPIFTTVHNLIFSFCSCWANLLSFIYLYSNVILFHKEWSQHANHVANLKSHILSVKKKKERETNRNERSAFVKFLQRLSAVSLAAEALAHIWFACAHWQEYSLGAEARCHKESEWKMCSLTWAADGHWWIEEDKYTERHRSCGMLAIPHQVYLLCGKERVH